MSDASRTALLVEDEPALRDVYAEILEELGFQVYEAANADEALIIVSRMPILDLVLTDVQMPGSIDGIEFVRRAAGQANLKRIIVMSGNEEDASDLDALFLLKPFTRSALEIVIS